MSPETKTPAAATVGGEKSASIEDNKNLLPLKQNRELLERELEAAGGKKSGSGWRCPWHDDQHPSGSIYKAEGGWRFKCHGPDNFNGDIFDVRAKRTGRPLGDILKEVQGEVAMSHRPANLPPAPTPGKPRLYSLEQIKQRTIAGKPFKEAYPYDDGNLVVRHENPEGGDKEISQYRLISDNLYENKGTSGPHPLYRQKTIHGADMLVIVEGEKCCNALADLGFVSTTSCGGSGNEKKSDWSAAAQVSRIITWPDNDKKGFEYDENVVRIIREINPTADIRQIDPVADCGLDEKEDVADLIESLRNSGKNDSEITEMLQQAFENAKPLPPEGVADGWHTEAVSLGDFMATDRPPLRFHIDGLLPELGKMLITAPAKAGKTFLAVEIGFSLATGNVNFLGLNFGNPARVLMMQPELSDSLFAARIGEILKQAPDFIDRAAVLEHFHIFTTDTGRPKLIEGYRQAIESEIERVRPDVLIADPLYMLYPGIEENSAAEMTMALDVLGEIAAKYKTAVILTHHHSKAGASRGSSVLQGWPETDLSLSTVNNEKDILKIEGLFRCCFGSGWPRYWRKPGEQGCWFESMPDDWQSETSRGASRKADDKHVLAVLGQAKADGVDFLNHTDLRKGIECLTGVSDRTAKTAIARALENGAIVKTNGVYQATARRNHEGK